MNETPSLLGNYSYESYYYLLLTNLIADVEAGIRMLDDLEPDFGLELIGTVPIKSTLRRAISEAKEGIRSFENE